MAWGWQVIFSGILENKNAAKLVLLRLADRADPEGVCWPGHNKTARELRISKTIVKDSIKIFEQLNLLHKKHRWSEDGDSTSNLYILNLNFVPAGNEEEDEGVGQPASHLQTKQGGGSTSDPPLSVSAPGVGQPAPQGGAQVDPEPKKEPVTISSSTRAARGPAPAGAGASDAAAAEEPIVKAHPNKALRLIHGVACWVPEDERAVAALLELFGQLALEAASATVLASGATPLPSRVLAALQARASEAQERQQREQAEARVARLEAASRARAERDLAELMALRDNQASHEHEP